jgi:polyisoprenoid-binding protein YceI
MKLQSALFFFCAMAGTATAVPATYNIDPNHTHPSFEVDHSGGLSTWRGTFKKTSGSIVLDTAAMTGTVDVIVDAASIDLAHDVLNARVAGPDFLDAAMFPTTRYKGALGGFTNGAPTTVSGELTLHGVTKPVALTINSFKCVLNPATKREVCGADATGTFNRADFGVDYGQKFGFRQDVVLHIQVEAIKTE